MRRKKRILVCPLDWGLGHATRCIPVIREFLNQNAEVIIGADNRPLALLQQEFPGLEFLRMEGYNIRFPANGNLAANMVRQVPKIMLKIQEEHQTVKKIINDLNIDAIISDNRYGLWNRSIPCYFITHQLKIKSPILENLLFRLNNYFTSRFTECWIPDIKDEPNLSGELSHTSFHCSNVKFIGPLSRFQFPDKAVKKKYDVLGLISGPEPQRTIFEKKLVEELKASELTSLVLTGRPERNEYFRFDNVEIRSHASSSELENLILSSELIISRPGYSTIMDLVVLKKNAVFIPTPGQTEQEYLAEYHFRQKNFLFMTQKEFNLQRALAEAEKYPNTPLFTNKLSLKYVIQDMLKKL